MVKVNDDKAVVTFWRKNNLCRAQSGFKPVVSEKQSQGMPLIKHTVDNSHHVWEGFSSSVQFHMAKLSILVNQTFME